MDIHDSICGLGYNLTVDIHMWARILLVDIHMWAGIQPDQGG